MQVAVSVLAIVAIAPSIPHGVGAYVVYARLKKGHAPWSYTNRVFDIDTIIDKSDRKLFRQATNPGHSLHHLLLPPKVSK